MVMTLDSLTKVHGTEMKVSQYPVPTTELLSPGPLYLVPRRRTQSIIFEEAKRNSLIPSPSHYKLKPLIQWGGAINPNLKTTLPRAARITPFGVIAMMNSKPELSTPSPHVYKPDITQIKPKMGPGHMGLKS